MRKPSTLLLLGLVFVLVLGVVAAGAASDIPSQQEFQEAAQMSTWHQPADYPDWAGPTSGGPVATEAAQPAAAIVGSIGAPLADGCGDATSGQADINTVDVELQDDGHWRFTVNLCSAYDLRDETGWGLNFATTAYRSDPTTDPIPFLTYQAILTHEVEYTIFNPFPTPPTFVYEPDATVYYNDEARSFVFFSWTGRPDGPTLSCAGRSGGIFGDPDREYTGGVSAATAFSVDVDPACFGDPQQAWLTVFGPGDTISFDGTSLHGTTGQTARIAGASRFETAVAISRRAFPLGGSYFFGDTGAYLTPEAYVTGATRVVYLTNGLNYPDALAASAFATSQMAGQAGPVLYWNATTGVVPNETLAEICRIQPAEIIALGGTLAVSDAAIATAKTAAASSDCFADYGLAR